MQTPPHVAERQFTQPAGAAAEPIWRQLLKQVVQLAHFVRSVPQFVQLAQGAQAPVAYFPAPASSFPQQPQEEERPVCWAHLVAQVVAQSVMRRVTHLPAHFNPQ
jgi:hypothetical protein